MYGRNEIILLLYSIISILTFRTQSSNSTTILIRESQLFIKLTKALWSAFSMSTPFIDSIMSPTTSRKMLVIVFYSRIGTYMRNQLILPSLIPALYAGPS